MRKTALLLLFFLSLTFLLPSCTQSKEDEDAIHVVTTIFPLFDWTREILGDVEGFSLTLLLGCSLYILLKKKKDDSPCSPNPTTAGPISS